jgi:anti-sigma B factor antagonist
MEVNVKQLKRVIFVEVACRLDHTTGREFQRLVEEKMEELQNYKVVVDLTHCSYISSVGLQAFLALRKIAKRYNRGDVRIAQPQPYVRDTLELVGFARIFEIFDNVVDAVGSF